MTARTKENHMPYAIGSVVAIGSLAVGQTVYVKGDDGHIEPHPVIGWASVVTGHNKQGHAETELQPLFVFDGQPTTTGQHRAAHGPESITDVRCTVR
jgi:hypothetical protein